MIKRLLLVASAFFVLTCNVSAEEWKYDHVDRVVAMSDIHGAYDALVETLQNAEIVGAELQWVGGESHLVIIGDILDRGPDSRAAMDLLIRLEEEAAVAGGKVHVLIGNHESMLLKGDMRYVSNAEYAAFAAEESAAEREHWLQLYARRHSVEATAIAAQFNQNFPAGFFAMRRAFQPESKYGRWLLQKNTIAVINGTAFVHGGLSPLVEPLGADGLNKRLRRILDIYTDSLAKLYDAGVILPTDSHYDHGQLLDNFMPALDSTSELIAAVSAAKKVVAADLLSTDGPLWYRSNAGCQPLVEEHRLIASLDAVGADRLVIGHTPTPSRQVLQRFGGRLIEVDTGMLNFYYKGKGHALVLEGDSITVVSQDAGENSAPEVKKRWVGRRSSELSTEKLESLLRDGQIMSLDQTSPSVNSFLPQAIATVSDGESTVRAVFNRSRTRNVHAGAAAYRLDRLLKLDMVPVTVVREVDGKMGSLQFLPENVVSEIERAETGQGGSASCSLMDQWPAMSVFDVLIYNEGRIQQRMLYDKSLWTLILSEHDRAFSTKKGRPAHLANASLVVHAGWKNALAELTDETLDAELGDILGKRQLKALKARRDQLLAEAKIAP